MQGKATASEFTHLDRIFIIHRNPKAIQQMQQKVVDYEQALQRQAELLLQQDRIKQEQRELKNHLKKIANTPRNCAKQFLGVNTTKVIAK